MKVEDNLQVWQESYAWSAEGDEWSAEWGGPDAQWYWAIFPRIHTVLPCETILEIAPGFGRWTQYLRHLCQNLEIVDLAPKCIEYCQRRFKDSSNIRYHVNDGMTLQMVSDHCVDFAFSFDSLVHVEVNVIDSYINELSSKLKVNGIAFLHHSNLAECQVDDTATRHGRASSVGAKIFCDLCAKYDISCISQEIIDWGGCPSLDCLSMITPQASRWARPTAILRNDRFMDSAHMIRSFAALYR